MTTCGKLPDTAESGESAIVAMLNDRAMRTVLSLAKAYIATERALGEAHAQENYGQLNPLNDAYIATHHTGLVIRHCRRVFLGKSSDNHGTVYAEAKNQLLDENPEMTWPSPYKPRNQPLTVSGEVWCSTAFPDQKFFELNYYQAEMDDVVKILNANGYVVIYEHPHGGWGIKL